MSMQTIRLTFFFFSNIEMRPEPTIPLAMIQWQLVEHYDASRETQKLRHGFGGGVGGHLAPVSATFSGNNSQLTVCFTTSLLALSHACSFSTNFLPAATYYFHVKKNEHKKHQLSIKPIRNMQHGVLSAAHWLRQPPQWPCVSFHFPVGLSRIQTPWFLLNKRWGCSGMSGLEHLRWWIPLRVTWKQCRNSYW